MVDKREEHYEGTVTRDEITIYLQITKRLYTRHDMHDG